MAQEKEGGSGEIAGPHTIETWIEGVDAGWPAGDVGRMIIHGLPRWFHGLTAAQQREALGREPRTTGTKWDALLAAMVEHLAELHGHPVPEWVNEPHRFLDETWVVAKTQEIRIESLWFSPPAFIRHGAIPDPLDLDHRGGERHGWVP